MKSTKLLVKRISLILSSALFTLFVIFTVHLNLVLQNFDQFVVDTALDSYLSSSGAVVSEWDETHERNARTTPLPACHSENIQLPYTFATPVMERKVGEYGYLYSQYGAMEVELNRGKNQYARFWGINLVIHSKVMPFILNQKMKACGMDESSSI